MALAGAIAFIVTGCSSGWLDEIKERNFFTQLYKPRPWGLGDTPPGSPEFQKGWNDGCETGFSASGNDRYKAAYAFKQDISLLNNPEYYRAWKDAYTHCRWYVAGWARPWQQ